MQSAATATLRRRFHALMGEHRDAELAYGIVKLELDATGTADSATYNSLASLLEKHKDQPWLAGMRLHSVQDLRQEAIAEPLIEGYIRVGEVMCLAAPPKARKTWLALDAAQSVACGSACWGKFATHKPRRVVYIDAESTGSMIRGRIETTRIGDTRPAGDIDANLRFALTRGVGISNHLDAVRLISQAIADADAEYCIIDTITRVFPIEDENSNSEATYITSSLATIAAMYNCGITYIHHTPKGSKNLRTAEAAAGAGAWGRTADSVLVLRYAAEDSDEVVLHSRTRSFIDSPPQSIEWYSMRPHASEWEPE